MTHKTYSAQETYSVAAQLASTLKGGETIALVGDLGAGKTTFAQGFCAALGVKSTVTSPTFAIMNVYEGRFRVVHLDLYRLKTAREIAALGLEEYLGQPDTVALIEWPEAVDGVQWNANVTVRLSATHSTDSGSAAGALTGESERTIDISYEHGGGEVSGGDGNSVGG